MAKFNNLIRTGFISVGAFCVGVAFERNFHLYADTGSPNAEDSIVSIQDNRAVDVVDSIRNATQPSRVQLISKHGFPSLDSLRSYANFVLSYDRRNRIANWVLEYVTPENIAADSDYDRNGIEFREDKSFHPFFRATNQDYRCSGYDRGHLAAAGNYRGNPEFLKQTFILSNVAPQVGRGFNRDKWNDLEKYVRQKVNDSKGVWICTGPLFLPQKDPNNGKKFISYEVIGQNHVAVPTHFFKVLLYQINGRYFMECFLLPNRPITERAETLDSFRINPEVIERAAGILLFNNIPKNMIRINP